MSTDQKWIEKTRTIVDPLEMLKCIVENQDFLGYDPYYSDLRRAMIDTAEQIMKGVSNGSS